MTRKFKKSGAVLCCLLLLTLNSPMAYSQTISPIDSSISSYKSHWVMDELAAFKQKLVPLVGMESKSDALSMDEKDIIRNYIFNAQNLDKPIKTKYWAIILDAVLNLPKDKKTMLLDMYVYGLATGDETAREDAVGGMIKLLSISQKLDFNAVQRSEIEKAIKDFSSVSEKQSGLVQTAYGLGVLDSNTRDYFRPKERLTVAEAVSMLNKVIIRYKLAYSDGKTDGIKSNSAWLDKEIVKYKSKLHRKLDTMDKVEAVILADTQGGREELLSKPISIAKWYEVLSTAMEIKDGKILHSYTYGLVSGDTMPRDVAVAGMMKLLHYNGMVTGRDATTEERLAAAIAFSDYKGAFDTSKLSIAYSEQLVEGYEDSTFRPKKELTNAEAFLFMARVIERYYQ